MPMCRVQNRFGFLECNLSFACVHLQDEREKEEQRQSRANDCENKLHVQT